MYQGIQYEIERVIPEVGAEGLWSSLCTITVPPDRVAGADPDDTFGPSGAPLASLPYVLLPGHENIPCKAAPMAEGRVQATEVKALAEIMAKSFMHVTLDGVYPAIIADYRATIDGIEYDILGVEDDSEHQMTRMAVTLVSV